MDTPRPAPGQSLYKDAWRRVRRDWLAMICLVIILLYTVVALLAQVGLLFPAYLDTVGERFEMKELPPGTTVYAHLLEGDERRSLPPEIKAHPGSEGDYRLFRGHHEAAQHYYGRQGPPIETEDLDRLAGLGLSARWARLDETVRAWIAGLPAARRDAVVAAGPALWSHLVPGGLRLSDEALARDGGARSYYESKDFGLDTEDLTEISAEGAGLWRGIETFARGWIQVLEPAERAAIIRGGPALWRGVQAAGLATAPAGPGGSPELPPDADVLWSQALREGLATRPPALASWLYSLPAAEREERLGGGLRALTQLGIRDIDVREADLVRAGFWRVHTFWAGSDKAGRDVLRLVAHGTKISMKVGLLASLIAIPIGLILGAIAGYFGGWIDDIIVWVYTTLACVPGLLLILAIAWAIGGGLKAIYIALGATTWVQLCRLIRGEFLKLREQDYVFAARALGAGSSRIILRHMIPNAMHLVIITFSLRFVYAILSEVVLSWIGVAVDPLEPSWGRLISDTQGDFATKGVWWVFTFTSLAMFFIVLALNIFGDALRDALDPKLRK